MKCSLSGGNRSLSASVPFCWITRELTFLLQVVTLHISQLLTLFFYVFHSRMNEYEPFVIITGDDCIRNRTFLLFNQGLQLIKIATCHHHFQYFQPSCLAFSPQTAWYHGSIPEIKRANGEVDNFIVQHFLIHKIPVHKRSKSATQTITSRQTVPLWNKAKP